MIPVLLRCYFSRAWSFLTLKYSLLLGLCAWAMHIQEEFRVPAQMLVVVLPWVGSALSLLSLLYLLNHFLAQNRDVGVLRKILASSEQGITALIMLFVLYSIALFGNGNLDSSPPATYKSTVLSVSRPPFNLDLPISYSWMNVRSWDNPDGVERLLLRWSERSRIRGGESIVIQIRSGNLSIPWVSQLELDQEHYAREVLKISPEAALAWKSLIQFCIKYERWNDASQATQKYLKLYPNDYELGIYVGISLFLAALPEDAMMVLNQVVATRPKDWRPYYRIGMVYKEAGRGAEAIAMLEETLRLRPAFPQVESTVASLRRSLATASPSKTSQ